MKPFPCCTQVSCLNLPQFLPNSSSLDDVSYWKDTKARVNPIDLSKVQRSDAPALSNGSAAAYKTGTQSVRLLPAVPGNAANAGSASARETIRADRAEVQLGRTSSVENPRAKSGQSGDFDAAAQLNWPPSPAVFSPQPTSRPAQQPSSWQLSIAAGKAQHSTSPSSNNLAAKSWQQLLSTASAHEQWVTHRHNSHGRTFDTGGEEEWGELLLRVPKQAGSVTEKLLQQLPQALAGSVHAQAALQVRLQPHHSAFSLQALNGGGPPATQ